MIDSVQLLSRSNALVQLTGAHVVGIQATWLLAPIPPQMLARLSHFDALLPSLIWPLAPLPLAQHEANSLRRVLPSFAALLRLTKTLCPASLPSTKPCLCVIPHGASLTLAMLPGIAEACACTSESMGNTERTSEQAEGRSSSHAAAGRGATASARGKWNA